MTSTSYRFIVDPNPPSFQKLQAIDYSTPVREVTNYPKDDGDEVFSVISVIEKFGTFEHVSRFTKPNNWETLQRYAAMFHIGGAFQIQRVFPSYRGETLYVSNAGDVALSSELYALAASQDDDNSSYMGAGQEDYSSTQDPEPSFSPSNADLLNNIWTFNVTQHEARLQPLFFALPKGLSPSDEIDSSKLELKMFLLCHNCRPHVSTIPHLAGVPGIDIKRPVQFLEKYRASLLWSLRIVNSVLRDEVLDITTQLQSDLDLVSLNDVETMVDKMIDYLQSLQPWDSMDWTPEGGMADRPSLSRHDIAALPSYLEPSTGQPHIDVSHQGMMLARDSRAHEQWVCPNCYQLLYPSHNAKYIRSYIGALGEYDSSLGRIILCPKNSNELRALCCLDSSRTGRVTELTIDTDWDATAEDLKSINALACNLGLTILTITTSNNTTPSDSAPRPIHHTSPAGTLPGSQLDNMIRLSRALIEELTHLTIVSDEALDAPAFLLDLRNTPLTKKIVVTTKDPSSTYLANLYDNTIQFLEMEASQDEAVRIQSMGEFSGNLQAITITDVDSTLSEEVISSRARTIKAVLRNSPDLCLLKFNSPASEFSKAEAMMESIFAEMSSELEPGFLFSTYTLVDNTDDRISATFTLPNSRATKSIIANVSTRNNGPGLENFLDDYGSFIRVWNVNNETAPAVIETLNDSIHREGTSQLTDATISLDDLDINSAMELHSMFLLSKATLRQLVLIGAPVDEDVDQSVLDILESLQLRQVVLFDEYSDMKPWISQVQQSFPDKASVIVLDQIEDLCRIAPGHDAASLQWLKKRQAEQKPLLDDNNKKPTHSSRIISESRRFRPSREEKPFRVLDANRNTTAVNTVPITNVSFGQVIFESDIVEKYGAFDHIESNGHLVPYLKDPDYPKRFLEPKQFLAHYEGDMASPDGYYDVFYTPYTGGGSGQ
ncbi:hypothetical protein BGW39_008675 [Mortierella sp. 14UC]|nr:hypothetical protein BGW39_008675 [Mortierella sp. 14UC]